MVFENQGCENYQCSRAVPDLIIEGGTAVTMVNDMAPIRDAVIFIADGRIADIRETGQGERLSDYGAEVINAKDAIIMPGLINTHAHNAMTLFRGIADDLPLKQWLFEKIFPAEARFIDPDSVYWGSLLGCLEMISSGTTCFADGYFFQDSTVRAVHESGMRALVAQGVIDYPSPGVEKPEKNLEVARKFIEKWLGYSDLIIPGIFCHSPVTCSQQTLKGARDISRELNLPLQIHLSETSEEVDEIIKREGKRPVHYLDQIGLINNGLIAAHSIHLDSEEMRCLKEKGVKIAHVPESNMKLCVGTAKVSRMIELGLKVGLGTDGCASNNNLDLFQVMDMAAKLSKVTDFDPVSLDARTVLKMGTAAGASVLGLEKQIGTLENGKNADIIVVDTHAPHLCPVYDPFSAVVYSASGADVKDVIVNGKVLMKDRDIKTLDKDEIMKRVNNISKGISI
ncbi:MAG TPA: amidohydrolase [Desulfobacteraceae bacterium]|nr:amidohydrolase [Desulfobacteraceae bacterium]